ncbi:alpha-L-rhamnosidase C-terminal domain-containing protein [Haliscomenobacter hydrossis]|nr:alpha-L-rhamnosidase C-terminal domain-containing protein [Haliscomenobacter hydrossis]
MKEFKLREAIKCAFRSSYAKSNKSSGFYRQLSCAAAMMIIMVIHLYGQRNPGPLHLRTDLLLHTDQISKNGLSVNVPLESATQQPEVYQFASVFNPQPQLSWALDAATNDASAYRILLASSPQLLQQNQADYWDSQKVKSGQTRATYRGKTLIPGKVYYWKVQVWNGRNQVSAFSPTTSFYLSPPDPVEQFAHHPLAAEIQKPVSLVKRATGSYFLDFGKDALSRLQLHLTSEKTDSIWIEVGELLEAPQVIHKNPGRNIRYMKIALLVRKGTHDYTITWPTNEKRNSRNPILMPEYIGEVYPFRYVSIENFAGTLTPASVQRKMVFYPFAENASSFTSSDTVLNQVWDLCKYSIKATSFTGYYVDGDRERIPYEADALINQLSHYAVDAEYSMARRSMVYMLYHPTWPTEWSLQNVLLAWNDYLYTGDDAFIKKYYPDLQLKTLQALAGSNHLISTRTNLQTDEFLTSIHMTKIFDGRRGLHDNVDWPQNGNYIGPEKEHPGETDGFVYNAYNSVVNAYYYRNLVLMEKMATLLQKTEDANNYRIKAQQVYTAFQTVFRDPASGLIKDGDSTSHSSLHANMFALAFGLVPVQDQEKVLRFMQSRGMACSVYGAQFLLEALYDHGFGDYALELMTATTQRSWYNMIRSGSTITLEAWDKVYKPNLDLNHAWGAAPGNIMVRKLMGIEPLSPGFDTFQIKPQVGKLTDVQLKTPTIKGIVSVLYQKNKMENSLEVIIPGGTTAHVYMPDETGKTQLWINGKKKSLVAKDGFFKINNMPAGRHHLTIKAK